MDANDTPTTESTVLTDGELEIIRDDWNLACAESEHKPGCRCRINKLLARLDAAERVCFYAERWLVCANPNTGIGEPLTEWRAASGRVSNVASQIEK